MILCHTVPEIWRVTDVICIFHFKLFFALLNILDFITNGNTGHVFFVEGTSPNTGAGFFFFSILFFFAFLVIMKIKNQNKNCYYCSNSKSMFEMILIY